MIQVLIELLPVILKILSAFIKTPAEKRADLAQSLLDYMDDIHIAVKDGKNTGDYAALENLINSRSHL